jgi:hypothetical protein
VNFPFSNRPLLLRIIHNQEKIMSALTDLQKAVSDLNASFTAELAAINAKLAGIASGTSDADIASVITDLTTLKNNIDAETAALTTVPTPAP